MATSIVPMREAFPRYHTTCDRCDCTITYNDRAARMERETPAGCFKFYFCGSCADKIAKMSRPRRHAAETCAIVHHAAKYSAAFAQFLSEWYGVKPTRNLLEVAHDK